jgi:hypothetical protein
VRGGGSTKKGPLVTHTLSKGASGGGGRGRGRAAAAGQRQQSSGGKAEQRQQSRAAAAAAAAAAEQGSGSSGSRAQQRQQRQQSRAAAAAAMAAVGGWRGGDAPFEREARAGPSLAASQTGETAHSENARRPTRTGGVAETALQALRSHSCLWHATKRALGSQSSALAMPGVFPQSWERSWER